MCAGRAAWVPLLLSQAMEDDYHDIYKIVLIGDSNVGKTSLCQRFSEESGPHPVVLVHAAKCVCVCASTFDEHKLPTVGVDFAIKVVTIKVICTLGLCV